MTHKSCDCISHVTMNIHNFCNGFGLFAMFVSDTKNYLVDGIHMGIKSASSKTLTFNINIYFKEMKTYTKIVLKLTSSA